MRLRILVLPLAAVLLAGLVAYKSSQTYRDLTPEERAAAERRRPAPMFTLHDQESQPFKLSRYAGRHKLVVAFFDANVGVDQDPQLQFLRDGYARLTAAGAKVIAISSATPFANRNAFERCGKFPFHILSDADHSVQTQWGCVEPGDPPVMRPAMFVIDRAGVIFWSRIGMKEPISIDELETQLSRAR